MGFFDAIKSAVNMVTGGAAKVSLVIGPRAPDGSFPAKIDAVAENDLKVDKVYLKIEGHETVTLKVKKDPHAAPTTSLSNEQEHHNTADTFSQEMDVAPALTMTKGQNYTWQTLIRIPPDAQPTYIGKNARHEWRAYAALSATGTDPASEWIIFKV